MKRELYMHSEGNYCPLIVDYTHGDTVAAEGLGAGTVLYIIWAMVTRKRIVPKAVVVKHEDAGTWQYWPGDLQLLERGTR